MISCHFTSILLFFSIFYLGSFQEENTSIQAPKNTQKNGKGTSVRLPMSMMYFLKNSCSTNLNSVCNELSLILKNQIPNTYLCFSLLPFSFSVFLIQYSYIPQFWMCNPKFNRVMQSYFL